MKKFAALPKKIMMRGIFKMNYYIVILNDKVNPSELEGLDRAERIEKMRARYQELADKIREAYPEITIRNVEFLALILRMTEEVFAKSGAEMGKRFNCIVLPDFPIHLV